MSGTGDLEVEVIDCDSQLVMDLFFPNIIRGKDAGEISSKELLDKIKVVDGTGSGLDADTLDGKHASDFLTSVDFPEGEVIVGGGKEEKPTGGGSFSEFETAFNNVFKIVS
ncbi:MAG: hypothetical protein NC410_08965 [Oscillibacter sp.]|nr:hypothetical protein [Oscillibacter sp.]